MLFLLFGLATKQKFLGAGEVRTCARCHNTTQRTRMREFRQFQVCGICGAAVTE